jgi:hypothetical protein
LRLNGKRVYLKDFGRHEDFCASGRGINVLPPARAEDGRAHAARAFDPAGAVMQKNSRFTRGSP